MNTYETDNLVYCFYDLDSHQKRIKEIDYTKPKDDKIGRIRTKISASKYIISMPSILKTNLFNNVLSNNDLIFKKGGQLKHLLILKKRMRYILATY